MLSNNLVGSNDIGVFIWFLRMQKKISQKAQENRFQYSIIFIILVCWFFSNTYTLNKNTEKGRLFKSNIYWSLRYQVSIFIYIHRTFPNVYQGTLKLLSICYLLRQNLIMLILLTISFPMLKGDNIKYCKMILLS